jgi:hypothetical protein
VVRYLPPGLPVSPFPRRSTNERGIQKVTEFNEAELNLLATATVMAEAGVGFTLNDDRTDDRAVADRLVNRVTWSRSKASRAVTG